MKKIYMMPSIEMTEVMVDTLLAAGSTLDPTKDEQSVGVDDGEYDGEFGSKRNNRDRWDDEDEEE